jgi:hypothetical protein
VSTAVRPITDTAQCNNNNNNNLLLFIKRFGGGINFEIGEYYLAQFFYTNSIYPLREQGAEKNIWIS